MKREKEDRTSVSGGVCRERMNDLHTLEAGKNSAMMESG